MEKIMSEERLLDASYRRQLVQEIRGQENVDRMEESLRDTEIYGGKIKPYVETHLFNRFGESYTEYPIISSINVSKKVTDARATLYREAPTRDFENLNPDQLEKVEKVYSDLLIDQKMMASNKMFELQRQTHVYCIPSNGRLKLRALPNHQLNVVPKDNDPEVGEIYILSSFNKDDSQLRQRNNDGTNQQIGDLDDYDGSADRFVVWSPSFHFVMDGTGAILNSVDKDGNVDVSNPISPFVPFVEVSGEKDFEYWTRRTSESANFTIEYNSSLSAQAQVCSMQGFAQAVLKAPANLMPTSITVGPTYVLKLITDPMQEGDVDFSFANPGADLNGIQDQIVSLLSQFLSTQGLDANAISASNTSAQKFSSGVERLLSLIEKFEASKDTMGLYENGEKALYQLVVAWMNVLKDTDQLDQKYKTSEINDSTMSIVFNRPEGSVTELEKLELLEKKKELGLISPLGMIAELYNMDTEQAKEKLDNINKEKEMFPDELSIIETPIVEETIEE